MTSHQVKGGSVAFSCDGCPETEEPEADDFKEAWAELREKGWVTFQIRGGSWAHYCPACAEDS